MENYCAYYVINIKEGKMEVQNSPPLAFSTPFSSLIPNLIGDPIFQKAPYFSKGNILLTGFLLSQE